MIFYRRVQGGLIFQPGPEVQQNLEAPVVRWALEVLCLLVLQKNKEIARVSCRAQGSVQSKITLRYRWEIIG